ncbi:hypothetical protein J15TS10_50660 [Paenibacillus woosongensis]|uniref:Uncharacterized protein n=1 Tax=Paenibacillus woosongensis TaxID=307580 RepID=A0ABQ4MZB4_9BACL|nr:hypothetical protein J15TS10_50660 [Paenibacillus woosongensis]
MEIGMIAMQYFTAFQAFPAGILAVLRAEQRLYERHCHLLLSASRGPAEYIGMRYLVAAKTTLQQCLSRILPQNLLK